MAIALIGPDGREYEIDDPAKVEAAKALGYRELTAAAPATLGEQVRGFGADLKETVEVGAQGALKGITAGLSDVVLSAPTEATGEYPQRDADMRQLREQQKQQLAAHPLAHAVGEVAGMVVSPVSKLGAAVTGGIKATTAIGRIGASAVGGGVEGMLFGAGNTLSDAALGDQDLTAEKLAAGIGLGGLLGFGGAGVGAGLAAGYKAIAPKVGRALAGAKGPIQEFADDRWLKAGGGIQSDIKKIPDGERAAVANVIREAMSPAGKVLPGSLDEAAAAVGTQRDQVAQQLLQQAGLGDAGGLLPKMGQDDALEALGKALEVNGKRVGDVLRKADAMGVTPAYSSFLRRLDEFEAGLNPAEMDLISDSVGKARKYLLEMGSQPIGPKNSFTAINGLKSTIGKDTNFVADGSAKYGLKRQVYGILRDEIDTQLAPQIGADLSKELLAAKSAYGALKNAEKALGRKTSTGADAIRALVEGAGLAEPSLAGKLSALDHASKLIAHGLDRQLGNRFISASDYLMGLGAGVMHGGPLGALTGLGSAIGHKIFREHGAGVVAKLADHIAQSPKLQIAAVSFGKQLQTATPTLGKYANPLLQAYAHSPASGLATHMAMAQMDPDYAEVAQQSGFLPETPEESAAADMRSGAIAAIAATLEQQDKDIDRGVERVFKGAGKTRPAGKVHSSQDFGAKRMRRDTAASHDQRVMEIRELAGNPDALLDRLVANMGDVSTMAPGIASALTRTADTAVKFLASEIQAPPKAGPLASEWVPNNAEIHKFSQLLETVQDPLTVLDHAAAGTLTEDQVRALGAVYPRLGQQIADKVLEQMVSKKPSDVPYRARLMLTILTGIDVDGSLSGEAIARNQDALHATEQQGAPQTGGPKSEQTLAKRMALPNQQREMESA